MRQALSGEYGRGLRGDWGKGIMRVREDREGRDSSGEGEACRIGMRRKGTVKEKRRWGKGSLWAGVGKALT